MNYRNFLLVLFLIIISATGKLQAQALPDTSLNTVIPDSLAEKRGQSTAPGEPVTAIPQATDSASAKIGPFQPRPKKSAMYSAIFPGMGQLYNRQYWKMGIVYAAVGVGAYFLIDNTTNYQKYRKAYVNRQNNANYKDEYTVLYPTNSADVVNQLQSYYKQYLDMTYLLIGVGYTLQVLDALIYAHLKNFDVSRDISMKITPSIAPNGVGGGIGLVMNFKYR